MENKKKDDTLVSTNKKKHKKNQEFYVIVYFFMVLFVGIILNFAYFMFFESETFINSPYNSLQDRFSEHVIRGELLTSDGHIVAKTEVDSDGNEQRVYPYNDLFAHVVGFDSNGKTGLENTENFELLRSHQFFLDRLVNQLSDEKSIGDNVVSTIDYDVQKACFDGLGNNQGAVIVMEAETGKIIGMVSKPDFDANTIEEKWEEISGQESTALFNRATQGQYAPGSTFKIITLLEYYREHPIDYTSYTYTCNGGFDVEEQTIHCANNHAHGEEDLKSSFANSCNASFSNIGVGLDLEKYNQLCAELLFNKDLPIDFVSSQSQFILNASDPKFQVASTAMGQGKTLVSPLHMALIASAVANDGIMYRPYLVDHVENNEGVFVRQQKPAQFGRIMTKEEAAFLQEYMLEVVNTGTATLLGRDGYDVAGKTGTAQVSDTSEQTNSWFVGYATKEGYPTIAIAAVVEDSDGWSKNALPLTKQVLDACFK